jgi:hypothetical protein
MEKLGGKAPMFAGLLRTIKPLGLGPSLNSAGWEVAITLQATGESQHEQNDEDDSPDPDSAIGAVCVIPAATAEQQN